MRQRKSNVAQRVEHALKEAHEAADSIGRGFMEKVRAGRKASIETTTTTTSSDIRRSHRCHAARR
jgi:hypothetical protein